MHSPADNLPAQPDADLPVGDDQGNNIDPVATAPSTGALGGWFPARRTAVALELLATDLRAFGLLYLIAVRCRWNAAALNHHGLQLGEAMVGDYWNVGNGTKEQYRQALRRLVRYGFVTITRATHRGTVVKLCAADIFDPLAFVSNTQNNLQAPHKHLTSTSPAPRNEDGTRANTKPGVPALGEKRESGNGQSRARAFAREAAPTLSDKEAENQSDGNDVEVW